MGTQRRKLLILLLLTASALVMRQPRVLAYDCTYGDWIDAYYPWKAYFDNQCVSQRGSGAFAAGFDFQWDWDNCEVISATYAYCSVMAGPEPSPPDPPQACNLTSGAACGTGCCGGNLWCDIDINQCREPGSYGSCGSWGDSCDQGVGCCFPYVSNNVYAAGCICTENSGM